MVHKYNEDILLWVISYMKSNEIKTGNKIVRKRVMIVVLTKLHDQNYHGISSFHFLLSACLLWPHHILSGKLKCG